MATVVVSVAVKAVTVAVGTVQGQWAVDVDGVVQLVADPSAVTFADVVAGDHVASAQAQDANGGPIGDKVSASFTVVATTVDLQGADVVTVSITAP